MRTKAFLSISVLFSCVLLGIRTSSAYDLKDLTAEDMLTLGAGLDKLPREVTDRNGLYGRIQKQIIDQNVEAKKAADIQAEEIQKGKDAIKTLDAVRKANEYNELLNPTERKRGGQ